MAISVHYAGDSSLLVRLGGSQAQLHRFVKLLQREPVEGVVNLHPAYGSVLIVFDALRFEHAAIEASLARVIERMPEVRLSDPKRVTIPVRYGGEFGPDLDDVAAAHDLSPQQVIEMHAAAEYVVAFLGFVAGFAYLDGLPEGLATPRLPQPRARVPAGSVGIAGGQTAVYPVATPGGWRLIGQTEVELFRASREPMSLLEMGDRVRFEPV